MPSEYRFHRVLSEHWGSLSGGKLTSSRKGEAERGRKKINFSSIFGVLAFSKPRAPAFSVDTLCIKARPNYSQVNHTKNVTVIISLLEEKK